MLLSRFHLPIPLRSTVITRFIATMRTLTPVPLLSAPGQVSLVHKCCASRHSVSTHPMRPCSGDACVPVRLGHRFPWGLPAVLRTSFTARSLVSRIWPYRVCVVGRHWTHRSTDYLFTFSCSPPHLAVTQLLSVTGGKLHQRGTLTLLRTLTPKRTSATRPGRTSRRPANWI